MKISDKEWQQYLEECHSNYVYCRPKKEDIEQFLTWRENKGKEEKGDKRGSKNNI